MWNSTFELGLTLRKKLFFLGQGTIPNSKKKKQKQKKEKKKRTQKLHAQDTTSKINPLLRERRQQAHFPSLLFCSLARKDNIKQSETRLLILFKCSQNIAKKGLNDADSFDDCQPSLYQNLKIVKTFLYLA